MGELFFNLEFSNSSTEGLLWCAWLPLHYSGENPGTKSAGPWGRCERYTWGLIWDSPVLQANYKYNTQNPQLHFSLFASMAGLNASWLGVSPNGGESTARSPSHSVLAATGRGDKTSEEGGWVREYLATCIIVRKNEV